jgi:hypothetical protein
MTRDEVIALARECEDVPLDDSTTNIWVLFTEQLEHFAARVAAAEREECAKVCEDIPLPKDPPALTHLPTIERCAAAIRARAST